MDFSILLVIAAIGLVIYLNIKRKRVVVDENSFYQNGVRVDFAAGTITIGRHTYPVNKVTGIRTNTLVQNKASMFANQGSVDIEVDDFVKPVHQINFNGYSVNKDTKEFSQRLSVAIRKAGGTSFT